MFIQTEETPNPNTLKFLPGKIVMGAGTIDFRTKEAAKRSPLASKLFDITGITGVFLGANFISVSKEPSHDWSTLVPYIIEALTIHFASQSPILSGLLDINNASIPTEMLDSISKQIVEILDTRIRPSVAQDGGDITFEKFIDGVVYLQMKGACAGCPSSLITLKNGIENMLRHYIPEVKEVQAITT
ncbi:MAG: NifU family protein [Candidatus Paracaedibacteraceae bacterium]|nr:NifU family protein [Candidatus Paracaedibacteraceae bacterium]